MKKVIITLLTILTITVLLFLNGNLDSFFLSQKKIKHQVKNNNKTGISSKKSSLLDVKKVINDKKAAHLIIFKAEEKALFFVTDSASKKHLVSSHLIQLSSNINGTKLYDESIHLPEGIYKIDSIIEVNTPYILLNFPNEFDINKQISDRRPELNSKISIGTNHDNSIILDSLLFNKFIQYTKQSASINAEIIIVPNDFRNGKAIPFCLTCPPWIEELYGSLRMYLNDFE